MSLAAGCVPLVEVVRNGFVESVHHGCVAITEAGGAVVGAAGNPQTVIFPRSTLKPLQLVAMFDAGLGAHDFTDAEIAVMASSHSGEDLHTQTVMGIFSKFDLDSTLLRNTPGWPMDKATRESLICGGVDAPASVYADCSGKHAAMIITSALNNWPLDTYREPSHPLQQLIAARVSEMTGDRVDHIGVDGCGAALFSSTLAGLARAYSGLMTAADGSSTARIRNAMRNQPLHVAGTTRDVTALMREVPGLLLKDGAEGVLAAGLPDGRAVALKIADGAARARSGVLLAALKWMEIDISGVNPRWIRAYVRGGGEIVGYFQTTLSVHGEA